ncbi:MAG TPA: SLC13 family permease [Cyanobacteria bacterium UBA11149]|nr:SLC13 family permease [Cyanobacteria bacterium UBA11367]HBE60910.1 SLC13 family permease [Cyanobacteria bacterium UBA11366]HBR76618.1 SLC13 family permease [Cyanobacteria bacterium UBA11159]HBS72379.1 SLC13 family permease [Cyanobacteria bacterium UBA11153]HBW92086.1 SLC13 family permease [Cyanobacteria bacterium UBA11149]HCA97064.1 SLC13 family permease [Cyanobacteria bacterium UBA9226]
MQIFLTIAVVILSLVFFIAEWLPVDITAFGVMIVLILLKLVTPEQGISGFSNSATITVMAMFILSAGIARTGAIQIVSDFLNKWGGNNLRRQILVLGAIVGPITAFINNTAVVAVFLPIVEDWCRKQRISPSKILMPLSFVTVLGGMITLIGTSTNVLASGLSEQLGYGAFGLFQFTALGLITFTIGLIYLAIAAPKLLPNRKAPNSDVLSEDYALTDYVSEIIITPGSNLIGQSLRSSQLQRKFDIDVLELIRNDAQFPQPLADKVLQAGDILIVRGGRPCLLSLKAQRGIEILPDVKFGKESPEENLTSGEEGIAEILILSNSNLNGSTLKELRFRQRYNATVLAIRRGEELVRERLGQVPLRFGDLLLVQGPKESFVGLQTSRDLLVFEQRDVETLRRDKAWIAIAIGLAVVIVAAFDWQPILVTSLVGVFLMIVTGCLKPGELYESVRWDIIFLLAGLIPLGIAMDKSGTTQWLADNLVALGGDLSGYWILEFFFIITALLTEILSNNASVVLILPVAVKVATTLHLNPYAFMFAVTFAASNSFMTPIGYQTNTMVYGPGGYKFLDFFRFGGMLNLIMAIITPPLIILLYGLKP